MKAFALGTGLGELIQKPEQANQHHHSAGNSQFGDTDLQRENLIGDLTARNAERED